VRRVYVLFVLFWAPIGQSMLAATRVLFFCLAIICPKLDQVECETGKRMQVYVLTKESCVHKVLLLESNVVLRYVPFLGKLVLSGSLWRVTYLLY